MSTEALTDIDAQTRAELVPGCDAQVDLWDYDPQAARCPRPAAWITAKCCGVRLLCEPHMGFFADWFARGQPARCHNCGHDFVGITVVGRL